MQYTAIVNVCRALAVLLLTVLLSLTIGLSAAVAVVVFGTAAIVAAILSLLALNRLFSLRRPLRQARRDPKAMFQFSLPVYMSTLIATFRPSLKTLLLGTLASISSVGIFSVASQVTSVGGMFHSSLAISSAPVVSKLHDRGAKQELKHLYQTVTKWSFALNLPLFLVLVLFPEQILLIFGESFSSGATALVILACGTLVHTGTGICGVMIDMSGNTYLKTLNSAVVTGLTLGLNLWLIPRWGLVGAALASLASVSILNGLRLVEVYSLFRMLPYNRGFFKPVIAGLGAIFVGWAVYRLLPLGTEWLQTAMAMAMLLAAYAGILVLLGVSAEDRAVLDLVAKRIIPGRSDPSSASAE
jgi:O-antigen/teichoic acid export membrane protein